MLDQRLVRRKLDHLRIDHDEFQLRRVFLIEERSDDGVDRHGLTGSRCTGYQQVRRLREVEHKDLVRDRSSIGNRQFHLRLFLEAFGGDNRVHRHHLRLLVRHLYTDGSLTRHRRDDTDSRRAQRQHDIILQRLNLRYADTCLRHYLIERYRRTDRCFDAINFYAIVAQGRHNTCAVITLLLFIDDRRRLVVIDLQQVQARELIELQVLSRIVRTEFL